MCVQKKRMLIEKSERKGYSPSLVFSRSSQQPTLFEYKPRAVRGDLEEVALLSSSLLSVSIFYNFHLPYKSLLKYTYNICCIICSLLVSLVSLLRVSLFPFMQSPLLFLFPLTASALLIPLSVAPLFIPTTQYI